MDKQNFTNKSSSPIKDKTSSEMDQLFDILNGGVQVVTTAQQEDVILLSYN